MTSLVGIRCRDGVVIGADSAAMFGDRVPTIEQPTERKVHVIGEKIILAGTGYVGHCQRFKAVVDKLFNDKEFMNKNPMEVAKMLSRNGLKDFGETFVQQLDYAALVAYEAKGQPVLCELPGGSMTQNQKTAFQPELKEPGDLWFVSQGSGMTITDPLLALFRKVFWEDGKSPNVRGGIFMALWALKHACEVNTGGINTPIRIAVLDQEKGKFRARELNEDQIAEHENMVAGATEHMKQFLDIMEGTADAAAVPEPPNGA